MSRDEVIEILKADYPDACYGQLRDAIDVAISALKQPEIIRCKDCKYSHMTYDGDCKYCEIWFPDEAEYMDGDYYCGSAERRQDALN